MLLSRWNFSLGGIQYVSDSSAFLIYGPNNSIACCKTKLGFFPYFYLSSYKINDFAILLIFEYHEMDPSNFSFSNFNKVYVSKFPGR